VADYERGVLAGERAILGRAITLIESARPDHQKKAQELLVRLLPHSGGARRVGITGVPGVGKSTFIESLGQRLTERGHRLAVLAVDPSSALSGGSILGDKTRMAALAVNERAFVRPSPTAGSLGGVARKTRETIQVCEAAGYDVVLVETVGIGQVESVVAQMVDFVLLLLLPNAGDELQGIKRGILELVDMVAINKADGENRLAAKQAREQYESSLRFVPPASPRWLPQVLTCSALDGEGLDRIWAKLDEHRRIMTEAGELASRRRKQRLKWMWSLVEEQLLSLFRRDPRVAALLPELEAQVASGAITPTLAASRLLEHFETQ